MHVGLLIRTFHFLYYDGYQLLSTNLWENWTCTLWCLAFFFLTKLDSLHSNFWTASCITAGTIGLNSMIWAIHLVGLQKIRLFGRRWLQDHWWFELFIWFVFELDCSWTSYYWPKDLHNKARLQLAPRSDCVRPKLKIKANRGKPYQIDPKMLSLFSTNREGEGSICTVALIWGHTNVGRWWLYFRRNTKQQSIRCNEKDSRKQNQMWLKLVALTVLFSTCNSSK